MKEDSDKNTKQIVKNRCPYCDEILIMNKKSFANHVRWCKSNPKYNEIRKNTIEKLSKKNIERGLIKNGKLKTFLVKCSNPKCEKEFEVVEYENKFPSKEKYYCCRSCSNSHKKTEETRKKTSEALKRYAKSVGLNTSEETFSIERVCPKCGKHFHSYRKKQVFCSVKCGLEYRVLKHYENLLTNCDNIEKIKLIKNIYKKQCSFRFALKDFPDEFDFDIIKENGWYKAKNKGNNLLGVSRDHCLSINDGFKNKIDPYYISHPANCSLMKHSQNSSKCYNSSITLEGLKEKICKWEEKYGKYENKIDYTLLSNIGFKILNA